MEERGRILVVDDVETNRAILCKILRNEYELATAENGEQCLEKLMEFNPDLVLLDVVMPGMDGYETCRRLKSSPMGPFTQVIFVSGNASNAERLRGYECQADDYIVKPYDHDEMLAKVRVQFRLREANLQLWSLNQKLQSKNTELERLVQERAAEVIETRDLTVFSLAQLADSRDPETGEHLTRIRSYSQILAEELRCEGSYSDEIDEEFLQNLYRASPLHDIGKVGVPDAILLKPGRLTTDEFEVMKQHVIIGAETLDKAMRQGCGGQFLTMAADVARYHHERFDGSGYCAGLKGTEIPLAARIVAVADVYDALTSKRVYKEAYSPAKSRKMIEEETGAHFDPVIVEAFLFCFDDFIRVCGEFPEKDSTGRTKEEQILIEV